MDYNTKRSSRGNNFMCAICLNTNTEPTHKSKLHLSQKNTQLCQSCQNSCECCLTTDKRHKERIFNEPVRDHNEQDVQTSEANVGSGLNLLNEVLTVFQKNRDKEKLVLKDVAVSTEDLNRRKCSRLSITTFHYSIDVNKQQENGKFTVIGSRQPEFIPKAINLTKNKSSSVPQMKMDELKYLIKEKTTSKDAIEEVNRMFATVRKSNRNFDSGNRPLVRSGPRVLPVVKNLTYQEQKKVNIDGMEKCSCRCCPSCMPCGDSCINPQCCKEITYETHDNKCIYMMCCHYQNKRKKQTGFLICEKCKNSKDKICEHDNVDD